MSAPKRSLADGYLAGDPRLAPLVQQPWASLDLAALRAQRPKPALDPATLHQVLQDQLAGWPQPPALATNLATLAQPGAATVVTGHQPVLGGGPLFTWYKALACIRRAQAAQAVPIFWVASEDHDADELNHLYAAFADRRTAAQPLQGAVGRNILTAEALQPLADLPPAFHNSYAPGRTWAQAFRHLLHTLLAPYGLVVLDADDPRLKRALWPAAWRELREQTTHHALAPWLPRLDQWGYKAQLTPRPINLFYLKDGLRARLEPDDDGGLALADHPQRWTAKAWQAEFQAQPERLSPNAALRPLYQELILPNLAYVGGPGELSYWLQLKPMFEAFGAPFPALIPRLRALLVPQHGADAWAELDLPPELLGGPEHAIRHALARRWRPADALAPYQHPALNALEQLAHDLEADHQPGQARSVRAQAVRLRAYFNKLDRRLDNLAARRHPTLLEHALALSRQVQPEGAPQERTLSLWAAMKLVNQPDPHAFIQHLWQQLDANTPGLQRLVWPTQPVAAGG